MLTIKIYVYLSDKDNHSIFWCLSFLPTNQMSLTVTLSVIISTRRASATVSCRSSRLHRTQYYRSGSRKATSSFHHLQLLLGSLALMDAQCW